MRRARWIAAWRRRGARGRPGRVRPTGGRAERSARRMVRERCARRRSGAGSARGGANGARTSVRHSTDPRRGAPTVDSAVHADPEPQPPPPPRLPQALDGGDDLRVRQLDHAAGPAAHRGDDPRGDALRVRPADHDRVPAVHPVQPARRRLGGPAPPPTDPHRRGHRPGDRARLDPGGLLLRRADDLAAVRRRLHDRHPHGLLRRRVPELPAVGRGTGPAGGGQLQAGDHPQRGADPRAGHGGPPHRLAEGAVRDAPRLAELCGLGGIPVLDPAPGAGGRSRTTRRPTGRSRRCARRSPSACGT